MREENNAQNGVQPPSENAVYTEKGQGITVAEPQIIVPGNTKTARNSFRYFLNFYFCKTEISNIAPNSPAYPIQLFAS